MIGLRSFHRSSGASWLQAVRQTWNAFVIQPGYQMTLPYDVRLTGITGEVITATDVVTDLNGQSLFDMVAQFEPCSLFSDGFENGGTSLWSATVP